MSRLDFTEILSEEYNLLPAQLNKRLLCYLNCVFKCLMANNYNFGQKVSELDQRSVLTDSDLDEILILCKLFSPDKLLNKCFFEDDSKSAANFENKTLPVNNFPDLNIPDILSIGDGSWNVISVLFIGKRFLQENYHQPMNFYRNRISNIETRKHETTNTCCSIL
ncbi:unnamed protein product [Mytilus edulis]|uniref:Uncharacterized protein n=1 Tax=Mytilus edulis TaxID=6550 RepID=A0A8S3U9M4_MYTED|nr:unnamed protein product [Mytilus edulis]